MNYLLGPQVHLVLLIRLVIHMSYLLKQQGPVENHKSLQLQLQEPWVHRKNLQHLQEGLLELHRNLLQVKQQVLWGNRRSQQLQQQKLELLVIHMNLQLERQVRWPEQDQSRIQSLPEQDLNMS